jgi:hypothetical protein
MANTLTFETGTQKSESTPSRQNRVMKIRIRLARLDSGLDAMRSPGPVRVRVELSTP